MSELIQKKKVLTFEELCPEWSALISQYGGFSKIPKIFRTVRYGGKRTLSDYRRCIVGEAHGGGSYWPSVDEIGVKCSGCVSFSMSFYETHNEEYYETEKSDFVQHFNEVHVK